MLTTFVWQTTWMNSTVALKSIRTALMTPFTSIPTLTPSPSAAVASPQLHNCSFTIAPSLHMRERPQQTTQEAQPQQSARSSHSLLTLAQNLYNYPSFQKNKDLGIKFLQTHCLDLWSHKNISLACASPPVPGSSAVCLQSKQYCFILQYLDSPGTYGRILFVDFSSAFNIFIPLSLCL